MIKPNTKLSYHRIKHLRGLKPISGQYFTIAFDRCDVGQLFSCVIIARRSYGNAVKRNKVKRRVKHILREMDLPNIMCSIACKPVAGTFAELQLDLANILSSIKRLII